MAKGFIFQLGIQASVAEDREINPAVCEKTLLYGICFLQEIQADIGVYPAESGKDPGDHTGASHEGKGHIQFPVILGTQIRQFLLPVTGQFQYA